MVELNSIPNVPLKIIFGIHFVLITWGIQGVWSPDSYLFYNFFFLLTLIWGIHLKEKEEPLQIAILINTISILFDILTISLFYHYIGGFGDRFSVFMAILNLVFRPISIMLLGKICAERMGVSGGEFPARFGSIFGVDVAAPAFPGQRNSYEDIDGPPQARSYHQQQQQQPSQNPPNQSVPESAYLSL